MPRSRKKTNSSLKSGFLQAIISLAIGIFLTYILGYLVSKEIIPSYSLTVFAIFNLLSNIISVRSMGSWGFFYTIGWLAGSLMFKEIGFLDTTDFILNIIVPIAILALRLLLWTRKRAKQLS
jgi:hypothetical protein